MLLKFLLKPGTWLLCPIMLVAGVALAGAPAWGQATPGSPPSAQATPNAPALGQQTPNAETPPGGIARGVVPAPKSVDSDMVTPPPVSGQGSMPVIKPPAGAR